MRLKAIVSYDGEKYNGYQRQPGTKTIQGTIEQVLSEIGKEPIIIYSSGRTDKGVHAVNQVFHFDTKLDIPLDGWKRGLNSLLPSDIHIKDISEVSSDFHARYSVKKKEYRYYIRTGEISPFYDHFSHYCYGLDVEVMKKAITLFIGTHDFDGFSGNTLEKNTIRTIYEAEIKQDGDTIEIRFLGNGFLKYMVRTLVGTLIDIGFHKKDIAIINQVFETKNRNLAGKTIEAKGLFLYKVYYE